MSKKLRLIIGIDEAGRGPLAGPLTLSAFLAPENLRRKLIKILGGKIKDSKQFLGKRREEIYKKFFKLRKEKKIFFCAIHISNKTIDDHGISKATKIGIRKSLNCIPKSLGSEIFKMQVRLDGSLKAPSKFKNQKTIIGGDDRDIFIACASIVAKVRRDRLMCRLAKKFPKYRLEVHKGYGTKLHYKMIKKYGVSNIHRTSFLTSLTLLTLRRESRN